MITWIILAGWAAHTLHWLRALAVARGEAAASTEWRRELSTRAAMLTGLAVSIIVGPAHRVELPTIVVVIAVLLFLAGQIIAIAGRSRLARAWSIGVRPRQGMAPVRSGLYASVRHPIYAGVVIALTMQLLLLQNLATLALVVGAGIVITVKILIEERLLAGQPSQSESSEPIP